MQLPNELKQAIDNNAFCSIATKINENEIQNHLMWVDYKENKILINTEQGRKKQKISGRNQICQLSFFIRLTCIQVGK